MGFTIANKIQKEKNVFIWIGESIRNHAIMTQLLDWILTVPNCPPRYVMAMGFRIAKEIQKEKMYLYGQDNSLETHAITNPGYLVSFIISSYAVLNCPPYFLFLYISMDCTTACHACDVV